MTDDTFPKGPPCPDCGSENTTRYPIDEHSETLYCDDCKREEPFTHTGHYSRAGGWWCDTCNSPYCDLA